MSNNIDVNDDEFVSMMRLWVHKNATYPLELITLLSAANGEKLVAIPDYANPDNFLFLGEKSYKTYQSALTKVGALMDKMNYPKSLSIYKLSHPLSCPAFCRGYEGKDDLNPYTNESDIAEWNAGTAYRLSEAES
ncbi:hypothetical protein [Pseudoalteromonas shioyasakiensis]|uniref:hypothetical protein n=1 Tax=Pseudoalteromonas shioyasakiensis TaxID=1190813 RepID=UPI0007821D95|nr:hypothetical protein [Pseudoalteromonas shioyasakiensis]